MKLQSNTEAAETAQTTDSPAVVHERLVLPLRVVDVDSPFFFGVARDMTEEERKNAEKHGRYDNPPMSVLGVTREGLAAVEGKELAQLFVSAPKLLAACQMMDECHGTTEWAMGQLSVREKDALLAIRSAIAESLGQNNQKLNRGTSSI